MAPCVENDEKQKFNNSSVIRGVLLHKFLIGPQPSRDLQATPLGPRPLLRVRATAVARVRLRVSYQVT